jgi:hypothetical protein
MIDGLVQKLSVWMASMSTYRRAQLEYEDFLGCVGHLSRLLTKVGTGVG